LYVLLAAVGLVLLIACANLANLTLARSTSRDREVAIRASIGAGRGRLIQQFLTESVLLSLIGGALGIALGYGLMAGLRAAVPPFSLPSEANITLDWRVLLFAVALSVVTGVVFGLAPAIQATRPNLSGAMKEGARGVGTGTGTHRLRSALVVAEVAVAFLLLTGSGLLIRSFFEMQQADTGFNSDNVLTVRLPIPNKQFPDSDQLASYLRQIGSNIESLPGVRSVALTSALPMRGWGYGMPFQITDEPIVDRANRKNCFFKMVSPSYFTALGMTLKRGRGLSDRDGKGAVPVAVINETMARMYFTNKNPIGKRILVQQIVPGKTQLGPEIPWEVVGVVKDEKVSNVDDTRDNPGMYVTNEQSPVFGQALVVRASMDPLHLQRVITEAVHQVNKDQALPEMRTLDQLKLESMASNRLNSIMLAGFATVALLLSAIGIYGVISYAVVQRTHEIGIRAALGASRTNVLALILKHGVVMAGTGLVLGLLGTLGLTRFLATLLFGVSSHDPITIAAVGAILAVVAVMASYVPAWRAAKVDPMICLRYE